MSWKTPYTDFRQRRQGESHKEIYQKYFINYYCSKLFIHIIYMIIDNISNKTVDEQTKILVPFIFFEKKLKKFKKNQS